jgi:hypothetical protein
MQNYAVLLVKNSPDNPEGLPLEWYRDVRGPVQVLDPELQSVGYQLMTDIEMAQRQATFGAEYQLYITTTSAAKETTNNAKIKSLKDLFDAGDVIEAKWATASNQEQKDLGRIGFQLVRKMRQALLDIYRP